MLRAALIGLPSSGKTTLFQLMTSAREAPRGKGDVNIGISKVPDARLDALTAMHNPKKRVPATVEFTDIIAPAKTGAQALVDVAGYKNADALVHVVRAFRDAAVPHPSGSIDPARDAQAMEDELILADLGVVERRLERLEKDLKKGRSPSSRKNAIWFSAARSRSKKGKPLRALQLTATTETPARVSVPLGQATPAGHQSGRIRHRRRGGRHRELPPRTRASPHFSPTPPRKPSRCAPRSSSRSHSSKATMPGRSSPTWD